jgi:phosphoserine phosphatase
MLVVTLISPALEAAHLETARAVLGGGVATWLSEGEAADISGFDASAHEGLHLRSRLLQALADAPIDIVVQEQASRRKRLLIADMDSTMIGQECIDELAGMLGLKEQVAAITEQAMRGEIAFEPALRQRVALLKGLPVSVVDEVLAQRITLTPGARTLIQTMRAHGAYTALVSGGFTLFTGPVAAMIGFDEHRANVLGMADGKLTGMVAEPILGAEAKLASLQQIAGAHGIPLSETIAVGDGANDLPMIRAAGLGVAFHAKPKVAAAAHASIRHGDLTALLFMQGYVRAAFVG